MKKNLTNFYDDELMQAFMELIARNNQKEIQRNLIVIAEHKGGFCVACNENLTPDKKLFLLVQVIYTVFEEDYHFTSAEQRAEFIKKLFITMENDGIREATESEKQEI